MPWLKCIGQEKSLLYHQEDQPKYLQHLRRSDHFGKQDLQIRVLLAYFKNRCEKVCEKMRHLPTVWESD